jgi:hypothetical protein
MTIEENPEKYSFVSLVLEGALFGFVTSAVAYFISQPLQIVFFMVMKDNIDKTPPAALYILMVMIPWVFSSWVFAMIRGKYIWYISTLQFMFINLVNNLIIIGGFVLYMWMAHDLKYMGLELFGRYFWILWNFFSGGSSEFGTALITFFPALFVFVITVGLGIWGLNALLYAVVKPLTDVFLTALKFEKVKKNL